MLSCHAPLLYIKYPRFPLNLAWASPPSLEGQTLEPLVKRILSPPSPRWTYSLSFSLETSHLFKKDFNPISPLV